MGRASTRVDHRIGSVSLCLLLKQLVHFLTTNSKFVNTSCCNQLQSGLATFSSHYVEDNIVEVEVTSLRSRQVLSNHAIERITTMLFITFETWAAWRLRNVDIGFARLEACGIDIIIYAEARSRNNKRPGVVSTSSIAVIPLCKMCLCRNIQVATIGYSTMTIDILKIWVSDNILSLEYGIFAFRGTKDTKSVVIFTARLKLSCFRNFEYSFLPHHDNKWA